KSEQRSCFACKEQSLRQIATCAGSVSSSGFQRGINSPAEMLNGTRRLRGGGHLRLGYIPIVFYQKLFCMSISGARGSRMTLTVIFRLMYNTFYPAKMLQNLKKIILKNNPPAVHLAKGFSKI
ncbi:MAG: hypothetical protein ACI4TH_05570, partial [Candidatus Ornithomonoglobus sp.]